MTNISLSNFIKFLDVRAEFNRVFKKPQFSVKKPMLAEVLTSNPQKIGTAFDYLVRFFARYLNSNTEARSWVAESSLERLRIIKDIDEVVFDSKLRIGELPSVEGFPVSSIEKFRALKNQCYMTAKISIELAKKNLATYLNTGKMNDDLIKSALELAQIDPLYRAGYLPPLQPSKPDENDIEDLRRLLSVLDPKLITADHTCLLNPVFGPEANNLMRADGDLVIDDILIDIKTVNNLKLDRKIFNQLIGYYTLYRIGGIRGMSSNDKITKLGIYFSRHGYLHVYNVEDLIEESTYPNFIEWFKKRALDENNE